MKSWILWVLIVVGIVLFLNPKKPEPSPELPPRSMATEEQRAVPYDPSPAVAAPPASKPQLTFGGYPCSDDCSAHREGFLWAQDQGIVDPDSCAGKSGAFAEGCRVFARKRSAESWNK